MRIVLNSSEYLSFALFGCLALVSLSTEMAGAAWLLLVISGAIMGVRSRHIMAPTALHTAAQMWLWICVLALLFRAVPVVYWTDLWEEQHAPLRLLLGALGAWGLTRCKTRTTPWALHGLAVAGILGLGLTLLGGRDGLPTNAIPWAVSMAMIGLLLLHGSVLLAKVPSHRLAWGVGAAAALAAVLVSETRGAYVAVLWAALWLLWHWRKKLTLKKLAWITAIALALLFLLRTTPLVQTPVKRIEIAAIELKDIQLRQEGAQNSSVGARVELWHLAASAIPASLWLGHGRDERLNLIHEWGAERNSATVASLGHMHNQYLHDLMDHGAWGLMSTLMYLFGLTTLACWLGQRGQSFAGWTIGSVAFMHAVGSLTNVNFAHNFYPTIMSIAVGLALSYSVDPIQESDQISGRSVMAGDKLLG